MKKVSKEIHYKRFIIPYRTYGSSNKYLLCINGAQQTMAIWKQFISVFSKDYTVIVFDFPGQGYGKIIHEPKHVTFQEQIECMEKVVDDQENIEMLYVYGASWGAIMASAFVVKTKYHVEKLILGSFALRGNENLTNVIREGLSMFDSGMSDRIGCLLVKSFGENVPDQLRIKIKKQFETMSRDHFLAFYHHSEFVNSVDDFSELINFSAIKAKTLLVYGNQDTIVDLNDLIVLKKIIPDVNLLTLDKVGHFLHFEDNDIMKIYSNFFNND